MTVNSSRNRRRCQCLGEFQPPTAAERFRTLPTPLRIDFVPPYIGKLRSGRVVPQLPAPEAVWRTCTNYGPVGGKLWWPEG